MPGSLSEDGHDFVGERLFLRIEGKTVRNSRGCSHCWSCPSLSLVDAAVWSRSRSLSAARVVAPKTSTPPPTRGAWGALRRVVLRVRPGWRAGARTRAVPDRAAAAPPQAFPACLRLLDSLRCRRLRRSRMGARLIYGRVPATPLPASTWRICVASGSATAPTCAGTAARTRATTRATALPRPRSLRPAPNVWTSRRRSTACWCVSRTVNSASVRRG